MRAVNFPSCTAIWSLRRHWPSVPNPFLFLCKTPALRHARFPCVLLAHLSALQYDHDRARSREENARNKHKHPNNFTATYVHFLLHELRVQNIVLGFRRKVQKHLACGTRARLALCQYEICPLAALLAFQPTLYKYFRDSHASSPLETSSHNLNLQSG